MQTMIAGLAAVQLGISTRTLGRWAHTGRIRSRLTPGGWRLYSQEDVTRLKRQMSRRLNGTRTGAR
jgi:DNA-binding transcriptional MerR regulator